MLEKLIEADTNLFLWLNSFHNSFFDSIMWFISGKKEWIPLYLLILGIIIYKYKSKSVWIILSISLVIACSDLVSTQVLKDGIQRFRPTHNPEISHLVHIVNDYRGGYYGFVSSHAANGFGLAVFIVLLLRNKSLSVFMLAWAVLVSYSRIYLGVHYPGDILGGALLGSAFAIIFYRLYQYSMRKYIVPRYYKKETND